MKDIKIVLAFVQIGEEQMWLTGDQLSAARDEAATNEGDFLELEETEPVEPATSKQVYGFPRTLVGYRPNGNPVFSGTGINFLLEVVGTNPDQFLPRGVNIEMTLKEGVKRPSGVETPWGVGTPIGFVMPDGYRMDQYEDKAKYYTQL